MPAKNSLAEGHREPFWMPTDLSEHTHFSF